MCDSVLNIHLEESTFPGSKYKKRSFLFDYFYGAAKEIEKMALKINSFGERNWNIDLGYP